MPKISKPREKFNDLWLKVAEPWTYREFLLFSLPTKPFEGRGEKSFRYRLKLPLDPCKGSCDIPELKIEIKCLESNKKLSAIIRLGQAVESTHFGEILTLVTRWDTCSKLSDQFEKIDDDAFLQFTQLAFSQKVLNKLPTALERCIRDMLKPSKVLDYRMIVLTTPYGFLEIPYDDFDVAFRFHSTTQARLQYAFNWRTYLKQRVESLMSKKIETTSCGCCVIKYIDEVPHLLLVRPFPDRDAWGIPKGHVNEGESHEMCAIRETIEEAGIETVLLERLDSVSVTYRNEYKTVIPFLARQKSMNDVPFAADGENVDIRFFPIDSLPTMHVYQRSLAEQVRQRVLTAEKELFNETVQTDDPGDQRSTELCG